MLCKVTHEMNGSADHATVRKASIHQLSTMLFTSKNVLFPGYNHLLPTGADDPSL